MFRFLNFGIRICLSFVICCLLFTSQAFAYAVFPAPSLNGPTGLVRIPSADVILYKNFNVGLSYGSTVSSVPGATAESAVYYMMNLGTFHGVEFGIVGGSEKGQNKLREGVFVNMKLSLSTGEEPQPLLLALGVENLFSYTQTDVYMVATKYFKAGPKLTFGFEADFPNYKFRPMGILGAEVPIGENLFILGDLMAGETLFQVNAGMRFYFTPLFSVNISGLNLLDGTETKDSRTALVGISWANPL